MRVEENDLVVLNDLSDGQVYMVKNVNGFNVEIVPYPGSNKRIQYTDASLLRRPTDEQLDNMW